MRKQITEQGTQQGSQTGNWLDLEQLAAVEVSSEAQGFPIENALVAGKTGGWAAANTGRATVTLRFDTPQPVSGVFLHFQEPAHERSQEFALEAAFADGTRRELVRQGWNFSPGGSASQQENYTFNPRPVTALTLTIDPDRGRDRYPATLLAWRVAVEK